MSISAVPAGTDAVALDLRGRIVLGFSLIVGAVLAVFGVAEIFLCSPITAALYVVAGCLLTFNALALLSWRRVDHCTHIFLGVIFVLGYAITLLSGGRSPGVLMATPIFAFIVTLVEQKRWAIGWYVLMLVLIIVAFGLHFSEGEWTIQFSDDWARDSVYRTPLIASFLAVLVAWHYRRAIEEFRDVALGNAARLRGAFRRSRNSHRRLNDFAEQAADWYWETDAKGMVSYLSPSFSEATGLPLEEVSGRTLEQLFELFDGSEIDPRLLAAEEKHQPFEDLRVSWNRPGGGEFQVMALSGRALYDEDRNFEGYRGVASDVTESHLLMHQMQHRAQIDDLSGVLKRGAFLTKLREAMEVATHDRQSFAVALIDLDRFKVVNDEGGHAAGDDILRGVGECLRELPEGCFAGRLGGDEFCLVIPERSRAEAQRVAELVRQNVAAVSVKTDGREFRVTASIGLVVEDPIEVVSEKRWLSRADREAYESKRQGGDQVTVAEEIL